MEYRATYWHYQSPRRHYANDWAMCIDKWYDDRYIPAIALDVMVYGVDSQGRDVMETVSTFDKFSVDWLAGQVEGVMNEYRLDFDARDKEDLVTVLIEILSSNGKRREN